MGKTLFISDLDGTLLNQEAKITPDSARIINGLIDEGLIFTYATARSFLTAKQVTGEINFKYPAVCHNGIFIQNTLDGSYINKCVIDKDKAAEIINICEKKNFSRFYPLIYAFIDGRERVSWISGKENIGILWYLKMRKNDNRLRPVSNYREFLEGDIYEINFVSDSLEELENIFAVLNLDSHFAYHIQKDTYADGDGKSMYWFEILQSGAGKDSAARKVKELVGADKIVCFGDNINDISMFNISDEKYAVENAADEVKNIATAIIGSNKNDGVAKWLEKNARDYF